MLHPAFPPPLPQKLLYFRLLTRLCSLLPLRAEQNSGSFALPALKIPLKAVLLQTGRPRSPRARVPDRMSQENTQLSGQRQKRKSIFSIGTELTWLYPARSLSYFLFSSFLFSFFIDHRPHSHVSRLSQPFPCQNPSQADDLPLRHVSLRSRISSCVSSLNSPGDSASSSSSGPMERRLRYRTSFPTAANMRLIW